MLQDVMSNSDMEKGKQNATQNSPAKFEKRPLVELKNGKVIFRQKTLSCEKMSETMQEIVKFRKFLDERAKQQCSPLPSIPDEHIPLIAKLLYESDKTVTSLARHIQAALQPEELETTETDGSDVPPLTLSAIESAILSVADRINYGIDWTEKISAPLCVWRWEVKEQKLDLLPRTGRDKFEARIAERQQAKKELRTLFDALSQSEKDSLTKNGRKAKAEGRNIHSSTDRRKQTDLNQGEEHIKAHNLSDLQEEIIDYNKANVLNGTLKKEKVVDPERDAKEKDKAEKKAAKEERERKAKEAQNKSRSLMSAFFKKPKASDSKLLKPGQSSSHSPQESEPSSSKSDFEKTFKPFVVKKDAAVAPVNWFEFQRKSKAVIVIDQGSSNFLPGSSGKHADPVAARNYPQELLSEFIANVPPKLSCPRKALKSNSPIYKSSSAYCVRDVFSRLSEAEVLGDISAVRSLQMLLKSRSKIPVKVLIFHEDTRPGYFGTFTKSSAVVGPRTPNAKDPIVFDYSYDSGEDWEEEEEGGDDLMSLTGSDIGDTSDPGSELGDWLIEDDDNDLGSVTPPSERDNSPGLPPSLPGPEPSTKRKPTVNGDRKEPKKRKVMPLLPFVKGPCWENDIGECEYEPFRPYKLQLFNDTPFPVDPFTFVSAPVAVERSAPPKPVFAIPALPAHVLTSTSSADVNNIVAATQVVSDNVDEQTLSALLPVVAGSVKRKAGAQSLSKHPFPETLLPYVADKIATLASGNLTWLVENLYQDLKAHKVKKNAIEAKVREVGEKCPNKKVWIVKEDVLRLLGRLSAASSVK